MAPTLNTYLPLSEKHLNLEQFSSQFKECVAKASRSVCKVERLQSYREDSNPSFIAWNQGKREEALACLEEVILEMNTGVYNDLCQRGISSTRIRLVEFPLTDYLKWEFETYKITSKCGDRILVRDITEEPDSSLAKQSCDCIIFDDEIVLVNDYSGDGNLGGGWLVDKPEDVEKYVEFFRGSLPHCVSLALFEQKLRAEE